MEYSERVQSLLDALTLEEKASLLAGASLWHTVPVERLGIPAIKVTDGPNGAARRQPVRLRQRRRLLAFGYRVGLHLEPRSGRRSRPGTR